MLSTILPAVGTGLALTSPLWVDRLFADNGIIFTKPGEGTIQAVMRGNEFSHFVMAYSGHKFKGTGPDDERWEIIEDPNHKKNPLNIFGWRLVGIPFAYTVYTYKLSWRELKQVGKESEVVPRTDELTNFAFASRFPYAMVLPDGETHGEDGEIIPVSLEYVAIIRITNPYKALFRNEDWPQIVESILNEVAKDYASSKSYEELIKEQTSGHKSGGFSDRILCVQDKDDEDDEHEGPDPGKSIQQWVAETYGVTIVNTYLLKVDPLPEYRELTQKRTTATIEADVIRTEAQGRADAVKIKATADAQAIREVGDAEADALRALTKASNLKGGSDALRLKTLAGIGKDGNAVVVAPDLLTPAAAKFLGDKPPKGKGE